jgi:tRNA A-37 threonylcarbamoyl transferase component Bud32/tetratricopeptide (TPR) repeat protein/TolB-like protein
LASAASQGKLALMLDVLDVLRESLAPRYDVEREIGTGGMARVYLAVEQHPRRRVAIKVLDPEVSTRLLRERFIREVDLSSNLSHPHIVPIFSAGEAGGLFYYVMPYVEGESLRHRLLGQRVLPLEDALHIAGDVADALAFAHGQGIIHRDIKPENILLSGTHAIVADFGIARAISAAGSLTLTQAGQPIGSPGYMSPEQALATGDLDERTDIYSLGCVVFEMLAGEPPAASMTERRVHNWTALETSRAMHRAEAGTARAVKHAISRALAPLPDDRFPTVAEFATALGGGTAHRISVPSRGVLRGRRGRRLAFVAGIVAALAGAGAAAHWVRSRGPGGRGGLNERRVVVAVIENHTGDPALDNIGHMAADWVTQGLAQTGLVEVVPSVSVMSSSREPARGGHGAGHLDAVGIRSLGRETGAGTVVSGAYYRQADSIRFQVQISAASDGTVLRALDPVAGPIAQPLTAVEALRQRVMASLATLFDSRLSLWAKAAGQPPSFPAYQEFIQGLDRMVQWDSRGAITHFVRAAREDTTFKLPLIFAAHEHMDLGEYARADSIAHAVDVAPGPLSPLDRHYLTWVLAETRGDRQRALETAREMAVIAPNSETEWLVAQCALALNRPREMANALTALGPDRGLFRGWSVYWFYLSFAHHLMGDYRLELKDALEGRRRHPDELTVLAAEVRALAAQGRSADINERLTEAPSLPPQPGWSPADIALLAAFELAAHDHRADAPAASLWAVRWLEGRPPTEGRSVANRFRLAIGHYLSGDLPATRRLLEGLVSERKVEARDSSSLRWFSAITGDLPDHLTFLGFLGVVAAREGKRDEALRIDRELQEISPRYLYGRHTMWRARIHAVVGEKDTAVELVQEAFAQGYPRGGVMHLYPSLASLRDDPAYQELLKPKE